MVAFNLTCCSVLLLFGFSVGEWFKKTNDYKDSKNVSARHDAASFLKCATLCLKERHVDEKLCTAVNYHPEENICELCNSCPVKTVPAPGWSIWTILDQQLNMFASCEDWKKMGCTEDGEYTVDSDGQGGLPEFTVKCKMNGPSEASETIIHHDREEKADAGNCECAVCCVVHVTYTVTIEQIVSVINASTRCEQFISYDYHGGAFYLYNYPDQANGFYSRDGVLQDYWGGAVAGSKSCACGMNNTCAGSAKCNCDASVYEWLSDYGYITDKNILPVTKMGFGDLGNVDEKGKYQLGPLRCFP